MVGGLKVCIIFGNPNITKYENTYTGTIPKYVGDSSVNRSQVDIKHKIYDIRTWKKHLFIGIINIVTLVPSFYQSVETSNIVVL